jgi:hypothetical protein
MRLGPTLIAAALAAGSYGAPQVKIGKTTLIGRDVTGLKQDFFGGEWLPPSWSDDAVVLNQLTFRDSLR